MRNYSRAARLRPGLFFRHRTRGGDVLGVSGQLENQDELLRRIDQAASYAPLGQLALSPQCGFASGSLGNLISHDDQRRKLDLVVDTARKVWE